MNEDFERMRGSDDPYADRGDPNAASKALKAQIMTEIIKVLRERELTAIQAAQISGTGRSQISRIRNGRLAHISLDTLVNVLDGLTKDRGVMLRIGYRREAEAIPPV